MEVWRFLGACTFYHIWIPDHTHIVEPLYGLLKKGKKFEWAEEDMEVVHRLKKMLTTALALRKVVYKQDTPVYIMVDTSPTGIGWVVNQEDENDPRFPIRFGTKVLSERQRRYAQVKRVSFQRLRSTSLLNRDRTDCRNRLPTDSRYGFRMHNS